MRVKGARGCLSAPLAMCGCRFKTQHVSEWGLPEGGGGTSYPEVKAGFRGSMIGHQRGRTGFPCSSSSRATGEHIWGTFAML